MAGIRERTHRKNRDFDRHFVLVIGRKLVRGRRYGVRFAFPEGELFVGSFVADRKDPIVDWGVS